MSFLINGWRWKRSHRVIILLLTTVLLGSVAVHTVKMGAILRQFTGSQVIDPTGIEYLSAVVMAISQINNKSDGFFDSIHPDITIEYAAEIPAPNFIAVLNSAEKLALTRIGGVDVCIGPTFATTTKASAQIFAQYMLPQIGWNSDATFSYKSNYPYYYSTSPPDGLQGKILVDMCKFLFGWNKVTVISSDDYFGRSASYEFGLRASELGIVLLGDFTFLTGQPSFHDSILSLKSSLASVFVILASSADTMGLLISGYENGLFIEGTQVLVSSFASVDSIWMNMPPSLSLSTRASIMKGVIGVIPTVDFSTP